MTGGPYRVLAYRHLTGDGLVFTDDFAFLITVEGEGTIEGETYELEVFGPDGEEVEGPEIDITDAADRELTATFEGLDLELGEHEFVVRRTDVGFRTNCAWGLISVLDARNV